MSSYKLTVDYGAPGDPDAPGLFPGEFTGLDADQAATALSAFLRDMLGLDGSRVRKLTIERVSPYQEQKVARDGFEPPTYGL